ncbi:hypothetical protein HanOQP8_Chr10g0372981 [Helianthus annuus]|nr:hypothetical protein HanOQP8_Chr10g0372981 [Helianthus annuus]
MFGALANKAYATPKNDKWRYDDSQFDNEEPTLKKRIEDKYGRRKRKIKGDNDSDNEGDDGDGDEESGDGGDVGASGASTPGGDKGKQAGDDDESNSDDNPPEPGYEHYIDERGVRQVRRIRTDPDADYVPSDIETERLRKKKVAVRRKKKSKKTIAASSVEPTTTQPETIIEPAQEAEVNPQFTFTAEETEELMTSPTATSEPPPITTIVVETPPVVTTQAQPQHATSSAQQYRSTTHRQSTERRSRMFSEMDQGEKMDFLFSQLQAAANQINRHSEIMSSTRTTTIKQQLEINTFKETVGKQQAEITQLRAENERLKAADAERVAQLQQMRATDSAHGIEMNRLKEGSVAVQRSEETLAAKHDDMREWYNERNTTLVDGFNTIKDAFKMSRKWVNTLWSKRCKAQEVLCKRDHNSDDVVLKSNVLALQACHPVNGEELEEGEFVSELSSEQILALKEMKAVDDTTIDEIPSEPEVANLDDLEETVFEGEAEKSKYVCEDGTEFNPFDADWLRDNVDEINEKIKSRDTSDVPTDTFDEWRKNFLAKTPKPAPPPAQVDYMKYEENLPHGRILSWMFVKEIHCMAVKREHGIQYFRSLLSILTLPFYDVAALAKLNVINRTNFEGVTLFACKLRMER